MAKKLYSAEETAKRFESLPPEIQDLLYSFEMTSIITKIGEKHGLHIDQMGSLNTETAQVMMGLTDVKDFPSILAEDLGLDATKAAAVAQDVNDMLFMKIRDAMKKADTAAQPKPPLATSIPIQSSAPAQTTPSTSVPTPPPTPPRPATPPPQAPLPVKTESKLPQINLEQAHTALTEPTVAKNPPVSVTPSTVTPPKAPQTAPPKPQDYKADPYREPPV